MATLAVLVVASLGAAAARGAVTSYDWSGTIYLGGQPVFPLVLSNGPPVGSTTPWGTDAYKETTSAGINVFRAGSKGIWTSSALSDTLADDRAAAAVHAFTWVDLSGYSRATPGSTEDASLAHVVTTLRSEASASAIALWKGRDEPWWSRIEPSELQFAYCRVTSRGDPSWCSGEAPLAPQQLWVTVEAPKGTLADLAPYSAVTDIHGVDVYPISLAQSNPDLHRVGKWTSRIAAVTPGAPVWTTIPICWRGSFDASTSTYVLPTLLQERYMAYDAIINGARALNFYGGNASGCWNATDAKYGWNWTFWQTVLKPLVQELSDPSGVAPALVNGGTTVPVASSDPSTEAILRQGASPGDLWLIAARSGTGTKRVTFRGLPSWVKTARVSLEDRTVKVTHRSLADEFGQWDVHVYHFVERLTLTKVQPARATVGSKVELVGRGLGEAKKVSFGGVAAHFKVVSRRKIVAIVPRGAQRGQVVVTSPVGSVTSSFGVLPSASTRPRVAGSATVAHVLTAGTGKWYGSPPTTYSFRWLACNARGNGCKRIPGATSRRLRVRPGLVGERLRVLVVARSAAGAGRARSAPTAVVAP